MFKLPRIYCKRFHIKTKEKVPKAQHTVLSRKGVYQKRKETNNHETE